jgi:hypothetical protein
MKQSSAWSRCLVLVCVSFSLMCSDLVLTTVRADAAPSGWSVISSPNEGSGQNELDSVSCSSRTECMAVGTWSDGTANLQTLAESRVGTTWSVTPTSNPGSGENWLNGVSCIGENNCVAVGDSQDDNWYPSLVESWNGTDWSVIPSPSEGNEVSVLEGVSCFSPAECVAVGQYYASGVGETLVEMWNGSEWSISPSPNPETENVLYGVSCTGVKYCVAVGWQYNGSIQQPLAEKWNGTKWSVMSTPNKGQGGKSYLIGVSCVSANYCVAGGYYDSASNVSRTLVERWNGASWSVIRSPNPGTDDVLASVSCVKATECVAVGHDELPSNVYNPLIETWNGQSWVVASAPKPTGSDNDSLSEVSCIASSRCTAVGGYGSGSVYLTLVESES